MVNVVAIIVFYTLIVLLNLTVNGIYKDVYYTVQK